MTAQMTTMSKEIVVINPRGTIVASRCNHPVAPGLDADFCKTCDTWWVDQQIRDLMLTSKSGKKKGKGKKTTATN